MRMHSRDMLLKVAGAICASVCLIVGGTLTSTAAQAAPHPSTARSQPAAAAHSGIWKAFIPAGTQSSISPNLVTGGGGGGTNCPAGTTNYSAGEWNCWEIDNDAAGHGVWIREGYNGVNDTGFGFFHFYDKHGLDIGPVEVVIWNNVGTSQPDGRYFYMEGHRNNNGNVDQWVKVVEQRTPGSGSPDGYELGVVTAFCMDGNFNEELTCPSWVNSPYPVGLSPN